MPQMQATCVVPPATVGAIVEITVGAIVRALVGNGFAIKLTTIQFLRCKLGTILRNKKERRRNV